MNFHSDLERQVFEKVAPIYERDGYEFVDPALVNIPSGTWSYQPDFLAKRNEKYVAFEIKARRTISVEKSLLKLKQKIEENKNWRFVIYYADEELKQRTLGKVGINLISKTLDEVRAVSKAGSVNSAFLLAWGAFEAAARETHSRFFAKPQSPGRIITVLAERGELSPDDAQRLRGLVALRNNLIHGGLEASVTLEDVDFLSGVIETLIDTDLE